MSPGKSSSIILPSSPKTDSNHHPANLCGKPLPALPDSIKTTAYFDEGFRQLDDELRSAMGVLAEAIPLDPELLAHIPWKNGEPAENESGDQPSENAQLLSIVFELLNMVEEHVAFRFRSLRRAQHGPAAVTGLWPQVLKELVSSGCSEEKALTMFRKVQVEPVLTAHPTEAKRPEVREKHLAIYRRLAEWEAVRSDPHRSRRVRESLRAELESLWMTGEIFVQRPSVENELQNAVYYLREVFPEVVLRLDRSLELGWEDVGWSVERLREERAYPQIRFATWIGGDRDGHPLVTSQVTRDCLAELRRHAARLHRRWLRQAAESLTQTPPFALCPEDFAEAVRALASSLGDTGLSLLKRNEHSPWRAWLYLLREKMGRHSGEGGYEHPAEYLADLETARKALRQTGAELAAQEWIFPLIRLAEVFGFHLAALDVRQNSATHDEAAAQLFAHAGIEDGASFASWEESRRQSFLLEELRNARPFHAPNQDLGEQVERVIAPLRVLAAHADRFGAEGLGQLIVSMTRQPSDLLLVHLLCREAGLATRTGDGPWLATLPVTPLFETKDDLAHADDILGDYLTLIESVPRCQPAMVGYSDSNKDAGVFASQWGIYTALERIEAACAKVGTTPQFFHGRGGTIGRGAGPTHWFLRALPPQSLPGPIRLTEQGEVLPRKYSHEGNAHYHLELLMAGVSGAVTTASQQQPLAEVHRGALEQISAHSTKAYHELLHAEGFVEFYRSATPVDALEAGTFGSRPPRRSGPDDHSLDNLRAIPWVFSWTQARFYLPGWFGVGSGLAGLEKHDPTAYQALRESWTDLPFLQYVLTNVESSLTCANLDLMSSYGKLCENEALRDRVLTNIRGEFKLTREQLAAFFGEDFLKRRPRLHKTLALREAPLSQLHEQQIHLLQEWRRADRPVHSRNNKYDRLFLALQLTINAISSGLRETG